MDGLLYFVTTLRDYLWNAPMLLLLFGSHLYFTVKLRGIQRKVPQGIVLSYQKSSGYSALATALAATIGTGNIIGVSTAIALGGPGAVFWCWLTGLLGIATCYAECYLSVKYRQKREDGKQIGGPMYVLEYGIGKKGLAVLFAVSAILASLGMGSSVQAHSIRAALDGQLFVSPHLVGIAAGVLTGFVIVGGNRQIAKVCTWLVPLMSIFYLGGCLWIMAMNYKVLPSAIKTIVISAFSKKAVAGGCAGGGVLLAMRTGISRGLFTNEAGLGSIPMTAASADTKDSVQQALISMTGPFWDTVVMCAVTGVAVVSSILAKPESYVGIEPERLCFTAFSGLPFAGKEILSLSMILFAFATIIGWNVYGVTAVRYLFGDKGINTYQVLYMLAVYLGAVMSMELVWGISDLFNSLMAIPNLFCLWKLRNVIKFPKTRIVKSKKKV